MSRTISPGLVDASHWTFVATAMADSLRKMIHSNSSTKIIPVGVYRAAQGFFKEATEAIGTAIPSNPVASAANYDIATKAIQWSNATTNFETEEEYNHLLKKYSETNNLLQPGSGHSPPGKPELEELAKFFDGIAKSGDLESYERHSNFVDEPR